MSDPEDKVDAIAQGAKAAITETAAAVGEAASQAGEKAVELARQVGSRASAAAETVYGEGTELLDVVEDAIHQNPWVALLVAGAIGYGFARFAGRK